ncbi:unnamed protein product [Ixodes pacificus]
MGLARCLNDSLPPITTTFLWFVKHVCCIVGAPQCPNVVDSTVVASSFFSIPGNFETLYGFLNCYKTVECGNSKILQRLGRDVIKLTNCLI